MGNKKKKKNSTKSKSNSQNKNNTKKQQNVAQNNQNTGNKQNGVKQETDTTVNTGNTKKEVTSEKSVTEKTANGKEITKEAKSEKTISEETANQKAKSEEVSTEKEKADAAPPPITRGHSLEMRSMSRKERKAAKKELYNEYTKDMTTWQRVEYFLSCYKWHILIPIICLALIAYVGKTIYKNSRPVALAYAILNVEDEDAINTDFQDSYVEYSGITGTYRFNTSFELEIDYDYFLEHETYVTTSNSTDYNILSTECELGDFDIIITNDTGLKYCSTAGIANQLRGYFDAEVYDAIKPYMYDSEDANGTLFPYALDISDTDFAKSLNTGYDDIYLAFPGVNDENKQNAIQLIEYIYNIHI
jgi:hypothetical protein